MGVFDGIERVAAEGTPSSREYFEPGNYVVTIDSVLLYEKKFGGGKLFIVNTTVEASDNPRIRPGEQRNWVQSFALPSALPRVKSFIGTALGFGRSETNAKVTTDVCNHSVSPANPLRGKRLKLSCVGTTTRAGKAFVQHVWGLYEAR